jgi:hypothetical protein
MQAFNTDNIQQPLWRHNSIVALRVIRGDEKEPGSREYKWATLFLEKINTRKRPPGCGSLESETEKCGHDSHGIRTLQ